MSASFNIPTCWVLLLLLLLLLVLLRLGCSEGGIGNELCKAFAAQGCQVFAAARRLQSMASLKQHGVQLLQLDVTDSKSVRQAVDDVIAAAGRIDVLVNNAGGLEQQQHHWTRGSKD
jgi:NADP-dependent 3-hydroxy acid dehydrogenase YdfG